MMSQRTNCTVSGFYPWPVPVSLSDRAAVFAKGKRLYRVDAQGNALSRDCSNEISQAVQTEQGIFTLEWTARGEAMLWRLNEQLRTEDRRVLFSCGPADLDRLPEPYDLEDWRNQKEYCLLTGQWVYRLSVRTEGGSDLAEALVLERTPLAGGETVRRTIEGAELEAALGGNTSFNCLELRAGDDTMWVYGDRVFLHGKLWDWSAPGPRHLLLQIGMEGTAAVLWDSTDVLEGRPCFFDFDRDIMWTYTRPGDAAHPADSGRRRRLPMVARSIAPNGPVLPGFPVWEDIDLFRPYFDGVHDLHGEENGPVVFWRDQLLTVPEE